MMKIRLFRPFPAEEIAEALKNVKAVALMDRTESYNDTCGPLGADVTTALFRAGLTPKVINIVYGLGGRDVRVKNMIEVYGWLEDADRSGKVDEPYRYMGVRE